MKTKICKLKNLFLRSGITFLILTSLACSEDDAMNEVQDSKLTYKVSDLNQCTAAAGIGTQFVMSVFYIPPAGKVDRLHITQTTQYDGIWEFGFPSFTNTNNLISFTDCVRFDTATWVKYEVIIESSDGSKSKPFTIHINKPPGAN